MNYGLYLSASGVLTNLYRQDVYANNLANVETNGFKVDMPTLRQRKPEALEDPASPELRNRMLEQLGGGVLVGQQRIKFEAAPIQPTGNLLDAALIDDDTFFQVEFQGANGQAETRFTRDGRFTRNADGALVTVTGGRRVLDETGNPIFVAGDGKAEITHQGQVTVGGEPVAQLGVVRLADTSALIKQGQNLFHNAGKSSVEQAEQYTIRPGYLEASGADPIKSLMQVTQATKAVTSNGNMIRYHDNLMDRAVNTLGRVA